MDNLNKRGGSDTLHTIKAEANPQVLTDYEDFTDGYYGPLMLQA